MKNKLLGYLTHNLGLKLMAVIFSVLLWLVAVSINDPIESKTFYHIPIVFQNTALITEEGKTYKEDIDDVNITVRANRSVVRDLTANNMSATADFSELSFTNTVPVRVSVIGTNETVNSVKPDSELVKLEIDNFKRKQLGIEVRKAGKPAEGYVVGKITTETNALTISGPEKIVNQVQKVIVDVSLDGASSNINIAQNIKLLDAEGKEVVNQELNKSIERVNVNIPILPTQVVEVKAGFVGEPADGYKLTGVMEITPSFITIAGKAAAIANVTEIVIPETDVDITGATEDAVFSFDMKKYLPDGVSLADKAADGVVEVKVAVEAVQRKNIVLNKARIGLNNVPEGYRISLGETQSLTAGIAGLEDDLRQVSNQNIVAYIDMAPFVSDGEIQEGEIEAEVSFILPNGVTLAEPVTVVVTVTREEE